jgi:uncharacterized protein (DUF305 family)
MRRFGPSIGVSVFSVVLICSALSQHAGHHGQQGPAVDASFASLISRAMTVMHEQMAAAPQTGDPDRDFLAMMIPHHEGAVEMTRLVLISGKDPLVRQLAEEIIANQNAEIAAMQSRLTILGRGADPQPGGFPAITGTRGN